MTGPREGYKLQETSFCILVGIYCHNTTRTPQWVAGVAKTTNIAKMVEKCINRMSARPIPLHTNPMESGPGNTFSTQNGKKTKRFMIFDPKKGESIF